MSKPVVKLDRVYINGISTPDNVIIKVFTRISPFVSGSLRLDTGTIQAVDPWMAAMKYMEHQESRGYTIKQISSWIKTSNIYVSIVMERALV